MTAKKGEPEKSASSATADGAAPRREGKAVDQLVDAIRNSIVSGRFVPGQRLVLRDLQEEFGFSRNTFREAFHRLAGERLVKMVPNRGIAVQKLNRDEIVDLFQIRESLEGLAAFLAAQRIGEGNNRRKFLAVHDRLKKGSIPERKDYIAYNDAFHRAILELSGNSRLPELLQQIQIPILMSRWRQGMTQADIEESLREHENIVAAICDGNAKAAKAAMDRHQQKGARRTLAALDDPV